MAQSPPRIPESNRHKHTGRRSSDTFVRLPHPMIKSPAFYALGGGALKMLMFLAAQYNGRNNGDLSATKAMVAEAGVCATSKLGGLLAQLEGAGFIVQTRHGNRKLCNLYALTWYGIDTCPGKSLELLPGPPRNDWRKTRAVGPSGCQSETQSVVPSGDHIAPFRGPKAA
ncbi:hypothetical protein PWP89_16250 [Stenotrophomonas rhizophila]|uniref:hypothetical protein n=1 Tax=Stenotrophomonas rhizophila TaxID=216778 RepID=UPI0015C4FC96|nr:hypothetical protein [Stenotrophomonas rhizophila]